MVVDNSFFELHREKQHIYLDIPQTGKVSDLVNDLKQLLELKHDVTLHRQAETDWEQLDAEKKLSDYGWTKDTALAHEPVKLAFSFPTDKGINTVPVSTPVPLPTPH